MPSLDGAARSVIRYYDRTESRVGYRLLLRGRKHFGWYEDGVSGWRFREAMDAMEERLVERLDLPAGSTVLDAGCGEGIVAENLSRRHGLRVVGIDILDFNLSRAQRRLSRLDAVDVELHLADYHSLPFANESFDGVYTMETLVHASDAAQVLREMFRVLRPGGRIVLFEYSRIADDQMSAEEIAVLGEVCDIAAMPSWLEFTEGRLSELLRETGFVSVTEEDVTHRMLPMLAAFSAAARLSYAIGRMLNRREKVINSLSAVEMYRHQRIWSYRIHVATKPEDA